MRVAWLPLALFGIGCGGGNPLHETALSISSAAAVGRSVELAAAAVAGTQVGACVQVSHACTTYPCDGAATVNLGAHCPLPLGGAAAGTVAVTGHFTAANEGTLNAAFTNVTVGTMSKPIALASVTAVNASLSGNTFQVTFAGENAAARSGVDSAAVGSASSWTLSFDTKGTADPGDDVLSIESSSAAGGAGLGTSAEAATLTGVIIDPGCTENPIAGSGMITKVSNFIPSITNISFHSACDGMGSVDGHAYAFDVTP